MKKLNAILVLLALLVSVNIVAKPKIRIIATGGTIAGVSQSATSSAYSAGQVGVQTLIDAVPQMLYLAKAIFMEKGLLPKKPGPEARRRQGLGA